MKTLHILPLAVVGLLLATGCDGDLPDFDFGDGDTASAWDTADTGGPQGGAALLTDLDWSCSPGSGVWTYYARTDGWAGLVTLDIYETGSTVPWDESHDLRNTDWAEDGTWDTWELNLSHVDTPSGVYPGSSTLFTCGYHADDSLTWMVTSYGEDNRPVDCAVFGHRPSYWTNDRGYYECLNWN